MSKIKRKNKKKDDKESTKEMLINLVVKLWSDIHPLDLTAQTIADNFGIRKASLFYHFDKLEDLYSHAYLRLKQNKSASYLNCFRNQIKNSVMEKKIISHLWSLRISYY